MVFQSAVKFLQLIQYSESFCYLVEMLLQVTKDITEFLIVFFAFNFVFVMVTYILETGYKQEDDWEEKQYQYIPDFSIIITII